ncbi:acetyltransferase [Pontibacter flavimaris]|uniref:N-acetylneuraminate synthase n=1 Tax=Pontibacter flavimaris TaxID=1797110 RepID=A0A1Q5PCK8_9BACT|nr:acetyltransferase [Pontibacter flavimaris]OKL39872.1 N-acetylneuraminate synthase [Pontibacter flavimaris]
MNQFALFGYSGHAFVIADAIKMMGDDMIGYYDRAEAKVDPFNLKYLGDEKDEVALDKIKDSGASFFVSIGDNSIRKTLIRHLIEKGFVTTSVIHPTSIFSTLATIGAGSFVAAGAIINPLAKIGVGAIINTGAIVEHECRIGDYVHIAPGAVLAGSVHVGDGSFIGANAVVKHGVKIGSNVIIGAGSVVLKDIAMSQTWVGNPAKRLG